MFNTTSKYCICCPSTYSYEKTPIPNPRNENNHDARKTNDNIPQQIKLKDWEVEMFNETRVMLETFKSVLIKYVIHKYIWYVYKKSLPKQLSLIHNQVLNEKFIKHTLQFIKWSRHRLVLDYSESILEKVKKSHR